MQQHIRILGWLYIIYSSIYVLLGAILLIILGGAGAVSGDRQAMFITGAVGVAIASILLILAVPGFLAGYGLFKFQQWARILAIVLGALHLFSFPFGTALGVYTFWVLLNAQTTPLFERPATVG